MDRTEQRSPTASVPTTASVDTVRNRLAAELVAPSIGPVSAPATPLPATGHLLAVGRLRTPFPLCPSAPAVHRSRIPLHTNRLDSPPTAPPVESIEEAAAPPTVDSSGVRFHQQGYSPPLNAAEAAIFQIHLNHDAVPVEQRHTVRMQLDQLAHEDGVRPGYRTLASSTRKKINRLGRL